MRYIRPVDADQAAVDYELCSDADHIAGSDRLKRVQCSWDQRPKVVQPSRVRGQHDDPDVESCEILLVLQVLRRLCWSGATRIS
jgi:hypothetical protein